VSGDEQVLPSVHEVMMEVYAAGCSTDVVELHSALEAYEQLLKHKLGIVSKAKQVVRARAVREFGSERKAAEALGKGRRTVRKRAVRAVTQ
jgi:hypothetical protein